MGLLNLKFRQGDFIVHFFFPLVSIYPASSSRELLIRHRHMEVTSALKRSLVGPNAITLRKQVSSSQVGISKNRGTPKSFILMGFSTINHPFSGTNIFGNTQVDDAR